MTKYTSGHSKQIAMYVFISGIIGGICFVVIVLYCCKICMRRRLFFENVSHRDSVKHGETAEPGGYRRTSHSGGGFEERKGSNREKKACVVQYTGAGTQSHVCSGGLQRRVSEEQHQGYSSSVPKSPRDDGLSRSPNGRDGHYKFRGSTVINIEPSHSRNLSQSSSSSSFQLDHHHSTQNSELPSPRSPRSRHNSGASSISRCGSRNSSTRDAHRASMKSISSRNSSFRRPVGGSLKDCKPRRGRNGSSGDPYLTIDPEVSPRRSVSLRSPRTSHAVKSPQAKDFLPVGFYFGADNNSQRTDKGSNKSLNPSPTMSTHSIISGHLTPLEVGLDWWKRKHETQLVQKENTAEKVHKPLGALKYNDVGSMEDICDSDLADFIMTEEPPITPSAATHNEISEVKHQYRALWELRATLEEEDWASAKNPPKITRMPGGPSLSPTVLPKDDTQTLLTNTSYGGDHSPDRDAMSSVTTSFESNTEPLFEPSHPGGHHKEQIHHLGPTSHASLVARRQSYKSVLQNRMKRLERAASIVHDAGNITETTTSFDSVETQESTSTDTSRLEVLTTSIESTDNTDSTADPHHLYGAYGGNRVHLRCDSGYKSFENGGGPGTGPPGGTTSTASTSATAACHYYTGSNRLLPRRCLSSGHSVEATSPKLAHTKTPLAASFNGGNVRKNERNGSTSTAVINKRSDKNDDGPFSLLNDIPPVIFAKVGQPAVYKNSTANNAGGTHSSLSSSSSSANTCQTQITNLSNNHNAGRRRREFGRFERHSIGSLDSVRGPLDEESGGSIGEGLHIRGGSVKGSLLYRYFRNPRSNSAYYTRDYSIDEKSDKLFKEFSRLDPSFDLPPFLTSTHSKKLHSRRHSSARGTTSLDLSSTRLLPSSHQTSPVSAMSHSFNLGSTSPTSKQFVRKGSGHRHHQSHKQDTLEGESHNNCLPENRSMHMPNMRFHGHTSIPIITVDDS